MASLYDITTGYASLLDAYDNAEDDTEREGILAMLAAADGELTEKAENYAKIIRMKEEEARAFKAEADRLTARKTAAENMAKRLKQAMLDGMKMAEVNEIKTSIGKWRLQNNPWSCEVVDIDRVPMEYHIKQDDKIDKKGLLDRFKATGEVIEGVVFKQDQGIRFR